MGTHISLGQMGGGELPGPPTRKGDTCAPGGPPWGRQPPFASGSWMHPKNHYIWSQTEAGAAPTQAVRAGGNLKMQLVRAERTGHQAVCHLENRKTRAVASAGFALGWPDAAVRRCDLYFGPCAVATGTRSGGLTVGAPHRRLRHPPAPCDPGCKTPYAT